MQEDNKIAKSSQSPVKLFSMVSEAFEKYSFPVGVPSGKCGFTILSDFFDFLIQATHCLPSSLYKLVLYRYAHTLADFFTDIFTSLRSFLPS
jgi:hypothetical protein